MDHERDYDEAEELVEYLDEVFFDMELEEQIQYLVENPDAKINPEDVECDYFPGLSNALLEKGEEALSIAILKKYFEAAVALQQEEFYRRVKPDFDAIYRYGAHLLKDQVTPFEEIDLEVKKMLISFCIASEYIDTWDFDDFLDDYPLLTTFYENLDEFAYADDDAMYPMLLLNVGYAYQEGMKHFPKDPEKAFRFFETGASFDYEGRQISWPFQKVADCAFAVARCYKEGVGVEKDLDMALEYYDKGAKEYDLWGVPDMAEIYMDPDFAWEEHFDSREDLIFAAYEACTEGADDYDDEQIDALLEPIMAEIEKFAENGNTDAQYRLAKAYEQGIFVEENLELALQYHTKLMEGGKYPYSACFFFEHHTPKDRESYQVPEELKVGDTFYLGQLIDEPLAWKVMEIHEDGPIAISEKVLAILPYNDGPADYQKSYIRHWLNDQFFPKAFTEEEKQQILDEEYYATSLARDSYGEKVRLQDHLFLPYSSNIDAWYGEGKEEWSLSYTDFALKTGSSDDCWLLDIDSADCPRHVNKNNTKSRFRYHAGCKLGIRPLMILKTK